MFNGTFIANSGPRVAKVLRRFKAQAPDAFAHMKAREKAAREADGVRAKDYEHLSELREKAKEARAFRAQLERQKQDTPSKYWDEDREAQLKEAIDDCAEIDAEVLAATPPAKGKPTDEERTAMRQARRRLDALAHVIPQYENGFFESISPFTIFEDFTPDLPEDASPELLAQYREEIDAMADRLSALLRAARPADEFESAVDAFIAEQRKEGAPDSRYALFGVPNIGAKKDVRRRYGRIKPPLASIFLGGTNSADVQLGFSALCWLFPDEVKARMMADAGATMGGMTDAERMAAIQRIGAEIVELMRLEEVCIRELESWGEKIERLPGRHIEAVLGIKIIGQETPPKREPEPHAIGDGRTFKAN